MIQKKDVADLRATYQRTLEVGLIIALALAIAAFSFFPDIRRAERIVEMPDEPMIGEQTPASNQSIPPPPVRLPIVIEATDDQALYNIPLDTDLNTDNVPPPPPVDDDIVFVPIFEAPEPVGGNAALLANVLYPEMAKRVEREGTVVVLAYIDKEGIVVKAEVVSGIGLGCDEAAVAAVKKTRFHPATQREKPVKVRVLIPLRFKLRR